jgi:dGTPase
MMQWEKLLSNERFNYKQPKERKNYDSRNDFESDYSRVVFSSAVRRLQDKAQVFPLESSGYVRTRLTHSMEVSSIARSLGVSIENRLIDEGKLPEQYRGSFGAILATIGLIHDLGNPPFGHFGEAVIGDTFKALFEKKSFGLSSKEQGDFVQFDGNAQTLRYVMGLHYMYDKDDVNSGYDLTFATLASLIKYPRASDEVDKSRGLSYKKIGYFQSESDKFEAIREATGIGSGRHPLVFLLEAADDIAYMAADVEDGFKKGVVSINQIRSYFKRYKNSEMVDTLLGRLDKHNKKSYYSRINENYPDAEELVIQWLRIDIQRYLIESAIENFFSAYDDIMHGSLEIDLLKVGKGADLLDALKALGRDFIYVEKNAILKELAGAKAIEGLLEAFIESTLNKDKRSYKSRVLNSLISPNYRFISENFAYPHSDMYNEFRLISDFISGMTDSYVIELFQKITGIKL